MIKSLFWNIRSINSNGSLERLKQLIRSQKLPFVALCEPFCKATKLDKYKRILGYANAYANSNSQIWIFWDELLECRVIEESEQQVTCEIK